MAEINLDLRNYIVDSNAPWIECAKQLPGDGLIVQTKIDDADGVRNVQRLKRRGNLWFHPDGSMYVYYTPTHWR